MDIPNNNYTSFGENFDTLISKINGIGFDGVLYSFFPKPMYMNEKIQPVLQYSESFAPFVAHYLNNNYGNRDFILRLALEGRSEAIDWWEEIQAGKISADEAEVTQDAKENFDIHHGLSIPVLYGEFAVAGISLVSFTDDLDRFASIKSQNLEEITELASGYHSKIIMSREEMRFFIEPLLERLNGTKKKVLKHMMSGQPMKTIQNTVDISPKYAEKVIFKMRKEFGDISTNELIYILGMVHIHEYL